MSDAKAGAQAKAAKVETVNRLLITGKRMNNSWQNRQKRKILFLKSECHSVPKITPS
jgi:hypothetical protein